MRRCSRVFFFRPSGDLRLPVGTPPRPGDLDERLIQELTQLALLGGLVIEDNWQRENITIEFLLNGEANTNAIIFKVTDYLRPTLGMILPRDKVEWIDVGEKIVFTISKAGLPHDTGLLNTLKKIQEDVFKADSLSYFLRNRKYSALLIDYNIEMFKKDLDSTIAKHNFIFQQTYYRYLTRLVVMAIEDCAKQLSLDVAADAAAAESNTPIDYHEVIKLLKSFGVFLCDQWAADTKISLPIATVMNIDSDNGPQEVLSFILNHTELLSDDDAGLRLFAENYHKRREKFYPNVHTSILRSYGQLEGVISAYKAGEVLDYLNDTFELLAYPIDPKLPMSPFVTSLQQQLIAVYEQAEQDENALRSIFTHWLAVKSIASEQTVLSQKIDKMSVPSLKQYLFTLNERLLEGFSADPKRSKTSLKILSDEVYLKMRRAITLADVVQYFKSEKQEQETDYMREELRLVDKSEMSFEGFFSSAQINFLDKICKDIDVLEHNDETILQLLQQLTELKKIYMQFCDEAIVVDNEFDDYEHVYNALDPSIASPLIASLMRQATRHFKSIETARLYDGGVFSNFRSQIKPIIEFYNIIFNKISPDIRRLEVIDKTLQDILDYLVQQLTLPEGCDDFAKRLEWLHQFTVDFDELKIAVDHHLLDEIAESICHDSNKNFTATKPHLLRQLYLIKFAPKVHAFFDAYPKLDCVNLWRQLHDGQPFQKVAEFRSIKIGSYVTLLLVVAGSRPKSIGEVTHLFERLLGAESDLVNFLKSTEALMPFAVYLITQYSGVLTKWHAGSLYAILKSANIMLEKDDFSPKNFPNVITDVNNKIESLINRTSQLAQPHALTDEAAAVEPSVAIEKMTSTVGCHFALINAKVVNALPSESAVPDEDKVNTTTACRR